MDWIKIISVILLGGMVIWLWPTAKHWVKNGPKGSSQEWLNFALILAAVVGFVFLLIFMVKK